jgi:hypothetical protein
MEKVGLTKTFGITDPTDGHEYIFTVNTWPSIHTFEEMRPSWDNKPLIAGEIWVTKEWVSGDQKILTTPHLMFWAATIVVANFTWVKSRVIEDTEVKN